MNNNFIKNTIRIWKDIEFFQKIERRLDILYKLKNFILMIWIIYTFKNNSDMIKTLLKLWWKKLNRSTI